MAGVREIVARAVGSGSLKGSSDDSETSIERVAALAFTPRLGSAFLRWHDGLDATSRKTVQIELTREALRLSRALKWRCSARNVFDLAERVLYELEHEKCRHCGGHGMVGINRSITPDKAEKTGICPTCSGTKMRKFYDDERAKALQVSVHDWRNHFETRFSLIRARLFGSARVTTDAMRLQLERD